MPFPITSYLGDFNSGALPNDTGAQAGGAGVAAAGFRLAGALISQISAAGVAPGGTAGDYIVALATIPPAAFDAAARAIEIWAAGSCAANGNTKTIKIFVNPTTPAIGSAISGGTLLFSSGAITTNGAGWALAGEIVKTGVAGANTQMAVQLSGQAGSAVDALANPAALTLTESAAITIAVTINCATTATDCKLTRLRGLWMN